MTQTVSGEQPLRDVRPTLEWFLRNIEYQLDDDWLIQQNAVIHEYWDTADVRRSVLGAEDFFDGTKFSDDKFAEKKTLVTCLGADGWLGTISLLEPHQAEFAKSLRECFGVNGNSISPARAAQFLDDIGLVTQDKEGRILDGFINKSDEAKAATVRRYAGQAEMLFKAAQCIDGSWKQRLARMHQRHFLDVSPSGHSDYGEVFADPLYKSLRDKFDQKRPGKSKNNVADAACICLLRNAVKLFGSKAEHVPHFFASRRTFGEVLDDLDNVTLLSYRGFDDKLYPVFRGPDYYIFKATFRPDSRVLSTQEATNSRETLLDIRRTVQELLNAARPLSIEVLNEISIGQRRLGELVLELQKYWFLERVWLSSHASEAVERVARLLEEVQSDPTEQAALQSSLNEQIDRILDVFVSNTQEYQWFRDNWSNLEEYVEKMQGRFKRKSLDQDRLYSWLGLDRFAIPWEFRNEIANSLSNLLLADEETERRELAHLNQICAEFRRSKGTRPKTLLIAVLLSLNMDFVIRDMALDYHLEEPWVVAMAAVAATREGKITLARRALKELEKRHEASHSQETKAHLAIGIAYVYFHLWRHMGGHANWRTASPQRGNVNNSELHPLIHSAIRYGSFAHTQGISDENMRVYALNLYLFYLIEGGSDADFKKLAHSLYSELICARGTAFWQYRFVDTLARYLHRLSKRETDPERRRGLIDQAWKYIEEAVDTSFEDKEVLDYKSLLLSEESIARQEMQSH